MTETALVLPPGVDLDPPTVGPVGPGRVVIDNRTELPNHAVEAAVQDYFVENASLAWGHSNTFQTYSNEGGSLLARSKFRAPANVFEEIRLARDLADRDDDVATALGAMIAVAYEGGMQNFHEDERTVAFFNEMAKEANLDYVFKEMYREYLIASQVTTVDLFVRGRFSFNPNGTGETVEERLAAPVIGVLPSEQVRVIGADLFGDGPLAYVPSNDKHRKWLEEFFNPETHPARKNAMKTEDPVSAALFVEEVRLDERDSMTSVGLRAYRMNPRMASRMTMPKGAAEYPRPLMTANFALLEAKRLLNIMDYALLQGGANFIVVAKKGTDQHRASADELTNLGEVVRKASRTGVIVGDHRLSFEIITPVLTELLNKEKRTLLGRKIASRLLRLPEFTDDAGTEGQKTWVELLTRVITSDRNDVKRHVERHAYSETARRNVRVFKQGAPKVWHPKIILQGAEFFSDLVVTLRDRGDIPRKFAVEAAGFDWEAGVAQRKRELAAGDDDVMMPASVPHDSPENRDGGTPGREGGRGRPPGARTGDRQDPQAPRRPSRGSGETVRAWWDEELGDTIRAGESTYRLLEAYPDYTEGRISRDVRRAMAGDEVTEVGATTVLPVNSEYATTGERLLRLAPGLAVIVGYRTSDDAIVAKALTFRASEFDEVAAEEFALRLGYGRPEVEPPAAE